MSQKPSTAYDGVFWTTYLANLSLMTAVSVLFRYGDFVTQSGGTAAHLGIIVGVGTIGALSMRILQGIGIDRFGPRRVWLISLALFVASMLMHLTITSVQGPAVYAARILMMTSLAGAFGASIAFVSLRVPEQRIAEIVGMLGSSGFVGMALGPTLGDWLFASERPARENVEQMFWVAAASGTASLILSAIATRGPIRQPQRRITPHVRIIRRYHPGLLLLVAVAMGWGIGLPHTFLRPYTESLAIHQMKSYFLVYAVTAFILRIATRRLPARYGLKPMIVIGLISLSVSMLLYLTVSSKWTLVVPALAAGVAHALLFPCVIAGGCRTFPVRYRGLATTLMLAMFDLGNLVGQPLVGGALDLTRRLDLPDYPLTFTGVSMAIGLVAAIYWAGKDANWAAKDGNARKAMGPPSCSTPSDATPSDATPSDATPSDATTRSSADADAVQEAAASRGMEIISPQSARDSTQSTAEDLLQNRRAARNQEADVQA